MRQNKLVEQETRTDPNIFQKRQTIDYQQRNIFRIARNKIIETTFSAQRKAKRPIDLKFVRQ